MPEMSWITIKILDGLSSLYRTLAVEHEGGGDDLLPVLPGAAQVVLAVAVIHLLPRPDGVLGHEVSLREDKIQNQQYYGHRYYSLCGLC